MIPPFVCGRSVFDGFDDRIARIVIALARLSLPLGELTSQETNTPSRNKSV